VIVWCDIAWCAIGVGLMLVVVGELASSLEEEELTDRASRRCAGSTTGSARNGR